MRSKHSRSKGLKEYYRGADELDDVLDWLQDHEQAWDDFCAYFSDVEDEDLTYDMVIAWISEHDTLYDDYLSFFGVDEDELYESRNNRVRRYEAVTHRTTDKTITRRSLREDSNVFVWDGVDRVPKDVEHVKIADGVKVISERAFSRCSKLTTIMIPDSVRSIKSEAFLLCTNLESITIPDGVTRIGDEAFSYCVNLLSIEIPDSVTSIGKYAFGDCYSLKNITIPDSAIRIGKGAFNNCPGWKQPGKSAQSVTSDDNDDKLDDLSWSDMLDQLDGDEDWMDSLYQEFCAEAYALVEKEGFTDVFTEPSTQLGRGGDFFWAKKDGVSYEGSYDFESEQAMFWNCCYEADSREEAIRLCAKKYAELILNKLSPVDEE